MVDEERKCLACGRPLTGRKKKYCGQPDCGGWEAVHPPLTIRCACGNPIETYKGSHRTMCGRCLAAKGNPSNPLTPRACIECGAEYRLPKSQGFLWCGQDCYNKYFKKNPQPEYFQGDWELRNGGLCFGCKQKLTEEQMVRGFCSSECEGRYRVIDERRRNIQKMEIQKKHGILASKVFEYVRAKQWFDLHPKGMSSSPESLKGYLEGRSQEIRRMKIRDALGLPYDAEVTLDEKTIPTTTELPVQHWLEENDIKFESQYFIELGDTCTWVDFFIPLSGTDSGICLYCDGDYWHGPDFPEVQEKDRAQVKELEELGYVVIRIKESEIQQERDQSKY